MSTQAAQSDNRGTFLDAVRCIGSIALFAVAPAATLAAMVAVGLDTNSLAVDFHHELYPQAKLLFSGENPYPGAEFEPLVGGNFIWPPLSALLVAPLTVLPLATAEVLMALIGVGVLAAALWVVGLRDWRCYGACFLWPQVAGEVRVAHLTPAIALLAALAWRERETRIRGGPAIGVAIALKFFAWPLAVWLAANRRLGSAALAAGIGGVSLLSVLPFTGLDDYVRALARVGRHFDQDSYTVLGFLVQIGAQETIARAVTIAVGASLLLATWRFRSFTLAIASALALSPIVWLDYFALAAIPLAIARPRLSPIWLLPLATWGAPGTGLGIGEPTDIARVLLVFSIVLGVSFQAESWERTYPPASQRSPSGQHAAERVLGDRPQPRRLRHLVDVRKASAPDGRSN